MKLEHTRSCPQLTPNDENPCTCALVEREKIALQEQALDDMCVSLNEERAKIARHDKAFKLLDARLQLLARAHANGDDVYHACLCMRDMIKDAQK